MKKDKLAKLALAAMVLASASPMTTEAANNFESGTFLAAGCAASAHGCAASTSMTETKQTTTTTKNNDAYKSGSTYDYSKTNPSSATSHVQYETSPATTRYHSETDTTYGKKANDSNNSNAAMQMNDQNLSYNDPQTAQMNYGAQQASYETYRYQNGGRPYQMNNYSDANERAAYGNPYKNDYRNSSYEAPTYQYGDRAVTNMPYSQYNQAGDRVGYGQGYQNEAGRYQAHPDGNAGVQSRAPITESQLKESVTPENWAAYQKLSAHAKSTALNLASQNPNRNQAITDAARVDSAQKSK